jgi:predicted phage-related endonuclease
VNAATAHAEFVESRRAYLGGTDLAGIIGVSPWSTPLSVYLDKVDPEAAEFKDSLPMRRGLVLERFIAEEFTRSRPGIVTYRPSPVRRDDWGFPAGASIDFMVARAERPRTPIALMDAKTAMSFYGRRQWQEPDPDRGLEEGDLPDAYYVQLQYYLAVTGLPMAYAAADTGDDSLTVVPVKPRAKTQEKLIKAGRQFWQDHVLTGIPPEPNGSKTDGDALGRMFPETIPDPPVYLDDPEDQRVLSDYLAHSFKAKQHGAEADKAKQLLQARMGEHEAAVVGSYRLSWKTVSQSRIDSKALREKHPDVAAECTKETTYRKFDVPKEVG